MNPRYQRGAGFKGCIDYLLHDKEDKEAQRPGAEVIHCGGIGGVETAAWEMRQIANLSEKCAKPVVHFSVSLAEGERLDPDRWREVMREHMRGLKLDPEKHQHIMVVHNESRVQHCHVVVNAVSADSGRTPGAGWDSKARYKLGAVSSRLEKELGLSRVIRGRELQDKRRAERAQPGGPGDGNQIKISRDEEAKAARTGVRPLQERLGPAIKTALREKEWAGREIALAKLGLRLETYAGPNGKRAGLTIVSMTDTKDRCAASALGSDYGLRALEKRTASEQKWQEWQAAPERAKVLREIESAGMKREEMRLAKIRQDAEPRPVRDRRGLKQEFEAERAATRSMFARHREELKRDRDLVKSENAAMRARMGEQRKDFAEKVRGRPDAAEKMRDLKRAESAQWQWLHEKQGVRREFILGRHRDEIQRTPPAEKTWNDWIDRRAKGGHAGARAEQREIEKRPTRGDHGRGKSAQIDLNVAEIFQDMMR